MAGLDINAIKAKQQEMKASIAKDVKTIESVNHVKKLEVENANCMASLLLAQNTMLEMTDYLDRSMREVTKHVERLEASNSTVKQTVQTEIVSFQKNTSGLLKDIGDDARAKVSESLTLLDDQLKGVLSRHEAIAATLERSLATTQQWASLRGVAGFLWRLSVFMTVSAVAKHYFQVDSVFSISMLKIWLGGIFL